MDNAQKKEMNDVVKQIVALDKRADSILKSASQRAEKIVNDTKTEIKEKESTVIAQTKEQTKTNYETQIAKAEEEKKQIVEDMEKHVAKFRDNYEKTKCEHANAVLEELLKS